MGNFDLDTIDLNFMQLSRNQILQRYKTLVRQFRKLAEDNYGVRPLLFDNYVMSQYFRQRSADITETRNVTSNATYLKMEVFNQILDRRRQIICWLFYLTLLSLCVAVYRYETSDDRLVVQSIAYPSMRMWRRMTMPIIQRFPRLTELYDETCLMGNPFFQLEDLSCRPCVDVENVWFESEDCELENAATGYNETTNGSTLDSNSENCRKPAEHVPYVFKSNQHPIELVDFYQIYANNYKIFQRDAYRVHSTSQEVHNLEDLFGQFNNSVSPNNNNVGTGNAAAIVTGKPQQQQQNANNKNINKKLIVNGEIQTHNLWRCNRMLPARLLRPIFARPSRLPSMGVALERYIAIDTPQAPAYSLPETECPNVFVHQAVGTRFIILRPTSECRHRCRTLSMRLTQSFVLSYNLLYWKPISAPVPLSDTLSISLIGSYC